jgi:SAM-dependent MidA family methyltransferase
MRGGSEPPSVAIRRAIEASGPLTFAEYMELALYGPGGFYETPPVGPYADFVTSPHVHPVFCELVGEAVRQLRDRLGGRPRIRLTEVGAGDGTLARCLLAGSGDVTLAYTAVERSPGARAALATIDGIDVRDELTGPVDVVVCNELLDNLPFRVLRGDREVRVGADENGFVEALVPPTPELSAFVRPGEERIVPVDAFAFIGTVARSLQRGYALIIDYGGRGTAGGPLHGYRDQSVVEDVLEGPGTTDITAGVDFELIATHAEGLGLVAFPSVTQRDALLALGMDDWLDEQLGRQRTQMEVGDGHAAVGTWSGRSRASLLIDPSALGRLRWLLLATPGLEPPTWLDLARGRSTD